MSHQQHVGSGVDEMGEGLVVHQMEAGVIPVLLPQVLPHLLKLLLHLRRGRRPQQHHLGGGSDRGGRGSGGEYFGVKRTRPRVSVLDKLWTR
eukprot:558380-Prorocentrum_minimum.AAC.1